MHALSKTFVDCHFHVFDAGVAQPQARYVPAYDARLEVWREAAQPHGIQRGVLVQTSFLGTDNTRLVRELTGHRDALRGVAVVAPDANRAELERLSAAGVRGIRLNLAGVSHGMEAWAGAHRLWDFLLAFGWHLELHADIGALPEVLKPLPKALPLVVDHMGRPDSVSLADPTVQALVQRARHAPVHVKLSGPYRLGGRDPKALAKLWMNELGGHRLLWGSDWPHTNHETQTRYTHLMRALEDWVEEDALHAVLVENPARLYWQGQSLSRASL